MQMILYIKIKIIINIIKIIINIFKLCSFKYYNIVIAFLHVLLILFKRNFYYEIISYYIINQR